MYIIYVSLGFGPTETNVGRRSVASAVFTAINSSGCRTISLSNTNRVRFSKGEVTTSSSNFNCAALKLFLSFSVNDRLSLAYLFTSILRATRGARCGKRRFDDSMSESAVISSSSAAGATSSLSAAGATSSSCFSSSTPHPICFFVPVRLLSFLETTFRFLVICFREYLLRRPVLLGVFCDLFRANLLRECFRDADFPVAIFILLHRK